MRKDANSSKDMRLDANIGCQRMEISCGRATIVKYGIMSVLGNT
jgi:hypothetical protein